MSLIKTSIIACTVVNLTPKGNHHLPEIRSIVHSAAYTWPICGCSLYVGAAYTWVQPIRGCSLYMGAAYTWVQPIPGCSLYVGAAYTWVNTVISPHNITIETHRKVTRIKGMITC